MFLWAGSITENPRKYILTQNKRYYTTSNQALCFQTIAFQNNTFREHVSTSQMYVVLQLLKGCVSTNTQAQNMSLYLIVRNQNGTHKINQQSSREIRIVILPCNSNTTSISHATANHKLQGTFYTSVTVIRFPSFD